MAKLGDQLRLLYEDYRLNSGDLIIKTNKYFINQQVQSGFDKITNAVKAGTNYHLLEFNLNPVEYIEKVPQMKQKEIIYNEIIRLIQDENLIVTAETKDFNDRVFQIMISI